MYFYKQIVLQTLETKLVLLHAEIPAIKLGERAFEIVMARKMVAGDLQTTWFESHGSTPITDLPAQWPQSYRELVERRIALIESDRNIALIEQPECNRRWNTEPWDEQLERALREWLLSRLEGYFFGGERMVETAPTVAQPPGTAPDAAFTPSLPNAGNEDLERLRASWAAGHQPTLVSTGQLAAIVESDPAFLRLAEIYRGGPGFSVSKLVLELVEAESVPFLPYQRYKESGLRKRQDWEHVWDLQRQEDAIDAQEKLDEPGITAIEQLTRKQSADARKKAEIGDIPVPPKYASGDFKKGHWWKLRGKLDVPKERWISYPGAERDGDPSPVIAWAGWDHLQQAKALAAYYVDASTNLGWPPAKLQPLLAGLADLLPWLKQWHNTFDPEVTSGLGDYFAGFLDEEARKQGTTVEALNKLRLGNAVLTTPT